MASGSGLEIPSSICWMTEGKVSKKIMDQGPYLCCWAIAATELLESYLQIKNPKPRMVKLSCQELIDCLYKKCPELKKPPKKGARTTDPKRGDQATIPKALTYVEKFGLGSESDYKFKGEKEDCKSDNVRRAVKIDGFVKIARGDETSLVKALLDGPVAAQIDVHKELTKYTEGIFSAPRPPVNLPYHGVLVYGFGTNKDGQKFFRIKNNWGEEWGRKGTAKVRGNALGNCYYPIMKND